MKDTQILLNLYRQGKIKEALKYFDDSFQEDFLTDNFRKNGVLSIDFKKNIEKHAFLNELLNSNPNDSDLLSRKGVLYEMEMEHENAKHAINQALKIDPHNNLALQTKGIIHFNDEEFNEALKCFEKILLNDKNNSLVQFAKSLVLESMGKENDILSPISIAFDFNSLDDKSLEEIVLHIVNHCGINTARFNADKTLKIDPNNKLALKIKKFPTDDQNNLRVKISELYTKHLHRKADLTGLDYFENQILEGKSLDWVEELMSNSEEGKNYWN